MVRCPYLSTSLSLEMAPVGKTLMKQKYERGCISKEVLSSY